MLQRSSSEGEQTDLGLEQVQLEQVDLGQEQVRVQVDQQEGALVRTDPALCRLEAEAHQGPMGEIPRGLKVEFLSRETLLHLGNEALADHCLLRLIGSTIGGKGRATI